MINYPGSTVFLSKGDCLKKYGLSATVTDTPGIYSLSPQSEDEQITKDILFKNGQPDALVLILDTGKLEVQLPLFFQLKEAGFPLVVALTMWDISKPSIDVQALEKLLKSPVIPIKGLIGEGLSDLVFQLKKLLAKTLEQTLKEPDQPVREPERQSMESLNKLFTKAKTVIQKAQNTQKKSRQGNLFYSDKFDSLFLHPKKGLFLFAGIMFALFSSIFWLASPLMSAVDKAFAFLMEHANQSLSAYPVLADFISQGLLASFGSVFVFVPQVFILFVGIALLEDTGYLARAVALMDGPFSKIGLSGRSFVPFLAGYACAIPAALAVRGIPSRRERFMAYFSIPFMSCSARLPVYALLLSFLFYGQSAWKPALSLSLIYIASFALGLTAVFFLHLFLKKENKEAFLFDLPLYRRPSITKIIQNSARRTRHYIVKAGPAIFVVALAIWLLSHLPLQPELSDSEAMRQSYAGKLGQLFEPAFKAMGLDWRVALALIAAFAAREVFVSALVLVFSLTAIGQESLTYSLLESMKSAVHLDGSPIFTTASVSALIVFFMLSLQCLSTSAVIYKESGSLKWAALQFLSLNGLAYFVSVAVYQGLNWVL